MIAPEEEDPPRDAIARGFPLADRTRWWTCAVCWRQHRRWEGCICLLPKSLLFEAIETDQGYDATPMVLQEEPGEPYCIVCLATRPDLCHFKDKGENSLAAVGGCLYK